MKNKNIPLIILLIAIIISLNIKTYLLCKEPDPTINQVENTKENTNYRDIAMKTIGDYRTLYQNQEIVGHLAIPNTSFQVLVTQSINNEFYLNHNLEKKVNNLGNPFLDYRNELDDQKLLIYGHNSQSITTDFHFLENYLDLSFYHEHPSLLWQTQEKLNLYQIAGILIVTSDFRHMDLTFNAETWHQHLAWLQKNRLYETNVTLNDEDQLLILQTCYYQPQDSYLLLVAKKIKEYPVS